MKYDFKNMKHEGTLNKQGWKELPNGNEVPYNEPVFSFWYGIQINTLEYLVKSQTIDKLKDAVTIYTRHNDAFKKALNNSDLTITIDSTDYTVIEIQSDNSSLNGCDVITMNKVS